MVREGAEARERSKILPQRVIDARRNINKQLRKTQPLAAKRKYPFRDLAAATHSTETFQRSGKDNTLTDFITHTESRTK